MFLEQLSSGFSLQLAATKAATSAGGALQERISKAVYVRMQDPDTGGTVLRERNIRSKSPDDVSRICKLQLLQTSMISVAVL